MNLDTPFERGGKVYLIGIKGTGMCALAELLLGAGLCVSGSDTSDIFYTDPILKALGISYHEGFDAAQVPQDTELVIHSAAYTAEDNAEIAEALRRGLPLMKYPDALGLYSAQFDSSGISGVHGKTTTTALTGVLLRAAGLPAQILAGSAVAAFGGRSTLNLGDKYFVAETCEYRRHFLAFHPRRIVLTSIESDHQDYFPTYESIRDAFVEYVQRLPPDGELIYCADNAGASEVARITGAGVRNLRGTPYGFSAEGPFKIESYRVADEQAEMKIACFDAPFTLRIPGRHIALDAAAALALTASLLRTEQTATGQPDGSGPAGWPATAREALAAFSGSKRRSEILGEAGGVFFMDDYGHHPTAIAATLAGLKAFYPRRRLVVSFMSHTYTRTAALLDAFASCFESAGMVILHKIYPSAREQYTGGVSGKTLYEMVHRRQNEVYYVEEPLDAANLLVKKLKKGDLFLTMGAGDNWKLGAALLERFRQADTRGGAP